MKKNLIICILLLSACQKVEVQPEEHEKQTIAFATTGNASNVGPVSADIDIYSSISDRLFQTDLFEDVAVVQYCTDGLFANGKESYPVPWIDEKNTYHYFTGDKATVRLNCLEPNTTYHYRAKVRIGDAVRFGAVKKFTTQPLDIIETGYADIGLSVKWESSSLDGYFTAKDIAELHVPTAANFQELLNNCIIAPAIHKGKKGCMVTNDGKSIFFESNTAKFIGTSETGINPVADSNTFAGTYLTSDGFTFHFGLNSYITPQNEQFAYCVRLVQ